MRIRSLFLAGGALAVVAACTSSPPPPETRVAATDEALAASPSSPAPMLGAPFTREPGVLPVRVAGGPDPFAHIASCAAPHLNYYGGHVLSTVKIYEVNWGALVNAAVKTDMATFYPAITNSAYFDWLSEYNTVGKTPGTNQGIGRGTYGGTFTITPSRCPGGSNCTLSTANIANELTAQINAGNLPVPDTDAQGNVIAMYMIDFPPGITERSPSGSRSCQAGGFCAFHYTTTLNGKIVPFGVHPDLSDGICPTGCGGGTALQNAEAVHSHELIEAVTDAEVGLATVVGPPLAWYDPNTGCGEIGDICNGMQGTIAGKTVQLEWSNAFNDCIAQAPSPLPPVCTAANTPPGCRLCAATDNGKGCSGATPWCETDSTNVKFGFCVPCTTSTECTAPTGFCDKSATATDDTCRGCKASDCTGATPACETTGANTGLCVQCTQANPAACTGGTPICDTTQDKCVQCLSSANCADPTPVCNTTTHVCSGCTTDAQCAASPTGHACDTTGGALNGQCEQCTLANPTACTGATPKCDTSKDKCVGCLGNADCSGSTPICDGTTKTCRGCASNADCTSGVCALPGNPKAGQCVQCTSNATCPAPSVCDTTQDICVQCTSNAQCANPKPVCSADACRACAGDAECAGNPSGAACETTGGLAGSCEQCTQANPTACTGATPKCDTSQDKCVQCLANADCGGTTPLCDTGKHVCVGCLSDANCSAPTCQKSTCNTTTGVCGAPQPAPNGTSCNDGSACTQSDACQNGACVGGNPVVCSPQDQCHGAGACNPANGQCTNPTLPDGTACADGNACTQTDACLAGICTGGNPVLCTPLDGCHVAGMCNASTGVCTNPNAPDGTSCSDGDACTTGDTCAAGACTSGTPVTCTAQDACHVAGTCNAATGACSNPPAPDGTSCNDGDKCTQTDTCASGACTGGNPVTCTAQDECHVAGTCDKTTGACSNPSKPDGTACTNGTCKSGTCTPAADAGTDAGTVTDAGTDAGPKADASTGTDSGSGTDASSGSDSGSVPPPPPPPGSDAATPPIADSGDNQDNANIGGTSEGGGCSCRTVATPDRGSPALAGLGAIGFVFAMRGRRRKKR